MYETRRTILEKLDNKLQQTTPPAHRTQPMMAAKPTFGQTNYLSPASVNHNLSGTNCVEPLGGAHFC